MLGTTDELDVRGLPFAGGVLLELVRVFPRLPDGALLAVRTDRPDAVADLIAWSRLTGHPIVENSSDAGVSRLVIRKGGIIASPAEEEAAGKRLWIYTNLHCNLACDYCCVNSSPTADRRLFPITDVERIADEAVHLGYRQLLVTGGEPFMRADIDTLLLATSDRLPTTVLTNAMLLTGPRRAVLERLPRDRVVLQVSLDSPEPALHDRHRGAGSWQKAFDGCKLARSLGFRVRIAATCSEQEDLDRMDRFLEAQGFPPEDRVLRRLARLGAAERDGSALALARIDVVPELTYTATGVYWHPVGAGTDAFLVAEGRPSVASARARVQELVANEGDHMRRLAAVFHCA